MGLVDFQVILDNPIKVFFSGQTVSGGVSMWTLSPPGGLQEEFW